MAKYTTVAQVSAAVEELEEKVEDLQKAVRALFTLTSVDPDRPEPEFPQELPDPEVDRMEYDIAREKRREYKRWKMERRWLNKLGGKMTDEPDPEPAPSEEEPDATPIIEGEPQP